MSAYPESDALVGMAQSVWAGSKEAARVNFALSDRLKAELKRLLDKDIGEVFITDSEVRHIKKNHGQNEAARGQADITPADFSLIPFVMNEFDTAEHTETDARGNKKILFTKKRRRDGIHGKHGARGKKDVRYHIVESAKERCLMMAFAPPTPNAR